MYLQNAVKHLISSCKPDLRQLTTRNLLDLKALLKMLMVTNQQNTYKKRKGKHAYAHTQTSLKVLAKQTTCKLSDSYRPRTTTLQLLVTNLPPHLQVQRFIYKYQRCELWYLSSDAVPRTRLRKLPQNFCQAPCLQKYPFPQPLFPCVSTQTLPNSDFPGCAQVQRPFSVSELRHLPKPSCLFVVLYLQHPWPLVLFLRIVLKFLSAQLLMG